MSSGKRSSAEIWRPAWADESFCVWDLEIMWFERQAYEQNMRFDREAHRPTITWLSGWAIVAAR